MATNAIDPEKGFAPARVLPFPSSSNSSAPHNVRREHGEHTPLQLFQLLVGLQTPTSITQGGRNAGRSTGDASNQIRTENIGLYRRAKEQERNSRIAYICTSWISNTLYLLQILLAATFTALSAYKETAPVTLTVLGALNTVLAG